MGCQGFEGNMESVLINPPACVNSQVSFTQRMIAQVPTQFIAWIDVRLP